MTDSLEDAVMREIGMGSHYTYYNGSGSCQFIREGAVEDLAKAIKNKVKVDIDPEWQKAVECQESKEDSQYILTKTWVACSYAIQDALYRATGGEGFDVPSEYLVPPKKEVYIEVF